MKIFTRAKARLIGSTSPLAAPALAGISIPLALAFAKYGFVPDDWRD